MRIQRSTPAPVMVDRATVLNPNLSPAARLVYVVLLASVDDDITLDDAARLAGLNSTEDLVRLVAELQAVGAAEMKEHAGQGVVITVNEIPLLPAQRSHPCVPCKDCGKCSCEYMKGLCQECYAVRSARQDAQEDIARWQRQVDEGKTYAIGSSGARLHRWDCKSLNTVEAGLSMLEAGVEALRRGEGGAYLYWPKLPTLYTAEELRQKGVRKKNCGNCGPAPL